jgi:hypothetical protein
MHSNQSDSHAKEQAMDRQTMEVVYQEIDTRIELIKLRAQSVPKHKPTHEKIIELFQNLRDRLKELENDFLQQMADDYEAEREAEEEAHYQEMAEEEEYRRDYRMGLDRREDDYDREV